MISLLACSTGYVGAASYFRGFFNQDMHQCRSADFALARGSRKICPRLVVIFVWRGSAGIMLLRPRRHPGLRLFFALLSSKLLSLSRAFYRARKYFKREVIQIGWKSGAVWRCSCRGFTTSRVNSEIFNDTIMSFILILGWARSCAIFLSPSSRIHLNCICICKNKNYSWI